MEDIDLKIAQRFADWLTIQLQEKGLTMTKLAELSGAHKQSISAYAGAKPNSKTGRPNRPPRKFVVDVATALRTSVPEALRIAGYAIDEKHEAKTVAAKPENESLYNACLKIAIEMFNALSASDRNRLLKILIINYGALEELGEKAFEIAPSQADVSKRDYEEVEIGKFKK